jgi:preprotein translocase subunit SecE
MFVKGIVMLMSRPIFMVYFWERRKRLLRNFLNILVFVIGTVIVCYFLEDEITFALATIARETFTFASYVFEIIYIL